MTEKKESERAMLYNLNANFESFRDSAAHQLLDIVNTIKKMESTLSGWHTQQAVADEQRKNLEKIVEHNKDVCFKKFEEISIKFEDHIKNDHLNLERKILGYSISIIVLLVGAIISFLAMGIFK